MNVATLVRAQEPMSIERYREELARELAALGVNLVRFGEREAVPAGCDLVWDPGLAGARSPHAGLRGCALPVVATVHGAATLTMKARELNAGLRQCLIQPAAGTPRPVWNPDVDSPINFFDTWTTVPTT